MKRSCGAWLCLAFGVWLLGGSAAALASPAAERLQQRLAELLPRDSRWGLAVVGVSDRRELLAAGGATTPLLPGSLVKLLVSGAALEAASTGRGPQFTTELYTAGRIEQGRLLGDLYLRGSGNCFLGAAHLQKMIEALRVAGIREVAGRVKADGSLFDVRGFERHRNGAAYAAPGSLGLDLHTVALTVRPGRPDEPPQVAVEPLNDVVRLAMSANSTEAGSATLKVVQGSDLAYRVAGNLPLPAGLQRSRFGLEAPALYAAQSFTSLLRQNGITVREEATLGVIPQGAQLFARSAGPGLSQYLGEMNRHSLNVAADNLLLALGGAMYGYPASRANSIRAVSAHLERFGLHGNEVRITDGSGLQLQNRLTARGLARYLAAVAQQPWFKELYGSLPSAGLEGPLKNGTFRDRRFRAKTGHLEQAIALAGYGRDAQDRLIAFVLLVNSDKPLPPLAERLWSDTMYFLAHEVLQ